MAKQGRKPKINLNGDQTEVLKQPHQSNEYWELFDLINIIDTDDLFVLKAGKQLNTNLPVEDLRKILHKHCQNKIEDLWFSKQKNGPTEYDWLKKTVTRIIKNDHKGMLGKEIDPSDFADEVIFNMVRKWNFNHTLTTAEKEAFIRTEISGHISGMKKTKEDGSSLGSIDKNSNYIRNYFSENYKAYLEGLGIKRVKIIPNNPEPIKVFSIEEISKLTLEVAEPSQTLPKTSYISKTSTDVFYTEDAAYYLIVFNESPNGWRLEVQQHGDDQRDIYYPDDAIHEFPKDQRDAMNRSLLRMRSNIIAK